MILKYWSKFEKRAWKSCNFYDGPGEKEKQERNEVIERVQGAFEKGKRGKDRAGNTLSPLFNFIRQLQLWSELRQRDWQFAVGAVEFWMIHRNLDWGAFEGIECPDDAYAEFEDLWSAVRFLPDIGIIEQASERAKDRPLPRDFVQHENESFHHFASTAAHLQLLRGNESIMLPCRYTGKALGVSYQTISRFAQWACAEGLMVVMKEYGRGVRKATEFRFVCFPPDWP